MRPPGRLFSVRPRTIRRRHVARRTYLRRPGEDDLLVPKGRNQLQLSAQRGNIALQRGDLAFGEVSSALEARNVRLIDLGCFRDLGLSLAGRLAKRSHREMDTPLGAQPPAENPHWFRVTLDSPFRC